MGPENNFVSLLKRFDSGFLGLFSLSAIVYPEFLPTEKLFYLNIVTSLALYDYVDSRTCKHTAIKWPNDILANRKKVAGILIENSFSGSNINYSILGIGLNLNQSQFPKFPVPATSLSLETNETFDLENEWPKLLEFLNERYQQLQSLQFEKMKIDYLERLFGYRELCRFNREEKPFIGVVEDVDDLGRLHIATPAKRLDFDFKEVTFILG